MITSSYNIDVRRFRVLRELRDRKTVAAAADALHLTPSAVSQQIRALSEEIGIPLIIQQGRGVRLTPPAHVLIKYAIAIDHLLELAQVELTAVSEGKLGHVTIGTFASAIPDLVMPTISRLKQLRPRLEISIRETLDEKRNYLILLDRNDVDAVISVDYPDGLRWDNSCYSKIDLLFDPFLVALPKNHPLADQEGIDLKNLANQPWILAPVSTPTKEIALATCASAGFVPNIFHYVDNWIAQLSIVAKSGCVALVPHMGTTAWCPPGIVLRPLNGYRDLGRRIHLIIRTGSEANPNLVPLIDVLKDIVRELVASPEGSYYTSLVD